MVQTSTSADLPRKTLKQNSTARFEDVQYEKAKSKRTFMGNYWIGMALSAGVLGLFFEQPLLAQSSPDQAAALTAISQMTAAQRTYYQKHKYFQRWAGQLKWDFGIQSPSSYNYAIRTTTKAAYTYAIPRRSGSGLKAYVGGAFLDPNGQVTTIVCEHTVPGAIRPPDPWWRRNVRDNSQMKLTCREPTVEVPASRVTQ